MYNFSKLSQPSQLFVTTLTLGDIANIAAAKAIANVLAVPSFTVNSTQEQFSATCRDQANLMVSALNEVAAIKYDEVLELTRVFWTMRYYAAHPLEHLTVKEGDAIACFLGVAQTLPDNVCKVICENKACVVDAVNGFARILREINNGAPTAVEVTNPLQTNLRTI